MSNDGDYQALGAFMETFDPEGYAQAVLPCINCESAAVAIDTEYDEGYCQQHFNQQQRSSEPIEFPRFLA